MLLLLALLKFTMHTHTHSQVQTQAATTHSVHIWRCCCFHSLTHSLVVTSAKKAFISLDPTLCGASLTRVRALSLCLSLVRRTSLVRSIHSIRLARVRSFVHSFVRSANVDVVVAVAVVVVRREYSNKHFQFIWFSSAQRNATHAEHERTTARRISFK